MGLRSWFPMVLWWTSHRPRLRRLRHLHRFHLIRHPYRLHLRHLIRHLILMSDWCRHSRSVVGVQGSIMWREEQRQPPLLRCCDRDFPIIRHCLWRLPRSLVYRRGSPPLLAQPAPQSILSKRDFQDAVAIRYGFAFFDLAERCACGEAVTIHHAFVCPAGWYPSARHNELRGLLAAALGKVVSDVKLEPRLLPLTDESLPFRTCNRDAEARVDIRARGVWTRQQEAFFDVRVIHPKASLLSRSEVRSQLLSHERAKKRQYASRIIQVARGSFTPSVFATNGQCAPESDVFLKSSVSGIVDKNVDHSYSLVMNHLRCRIRFCLLRWAVTYLRGSRSGAYAERSRRRVPGQGGSGGFPRGKFWHFSASNGNIVT